MASVKSLQTLGFGIVFFGVTIGIGAYVIAQVDGQVSDTTASQIMGNANESILDMAEWLPILVVAAVGGLAIGFLITYLGGR